MHERKKSDMGKSLFTDADVRIIHLPPMTVASVHVVGQAADGAHAELTSAVLLGACMRAVNLRVIHPAARLFGFNNPDGVPDDDPAHGYERWVSIPDGMQVPAPLVKKQLASGLYAAHVIPMGAWEKGWLPLHHWGDHSEAYDFRWGSVDGVCGWLEEHLHTWDWYEDGEGKALQVDLLLPIQPRGDAVR